MTLVPKNVMLEQFCPHPPGEKQPTSVATLGGGRRAEAHLASAFLDFNVWSDKKKVEKLRYMHRNPVTRGLVHRPEEWLWGSFRNYAFGEGGPVLVNQPQRAVLKLTGKALAAAVTSNVS